VTCVLLAAKSKLTETYTRATSTVRIVEDSLLTREILLRGEKNSSPAKIEEELRAYRFFLKEMASNYFETGYLAGVLLDCTLATFVWTTKEQFAKHPPVGFVESTIDGLSSLLYGFVVLMMLLGALSALFMILETFRTPKS